MPRTRRRSPPASIRVDSDGDGLQVAGRRLPVEPDAEDAVAPERARLASGDELACPFWVAGHQCLLVAVDDGVRACSGLLPCVYNRFDAGRAAVVAG